LDEFAEARFQARQPLGIARTLAIVNLPERSFSVAVRFLVLRPDFDVT
jgi:hypothetical protein